MTHGNTAASVKWLPLQWTTVELHRVMSLRGVGISSHSGFARSMKDRVALHRYLSRTAKFVLVSLALAASISSAHAQMGGGGGGGGGGGRGRRSSQQQTQS